MPQPTNPQSFNRYSYSYNNPLRYTDPSGHCIDGITTLACIIAGVAVATKVIDYGITLWDGYQAGRVLANPQAAHFERMMAGLTVGLSIVLETLEPDDILPIGLPADDVARRAIINGAEEALEDGGPQALEGFLRNQLGDHADDAIRKMDELLGLDADSLYKATQAADKNNFTRAGRALQKHGSGRPGSVWADYLPTGTLNPSNYNAKANELVTEILTNPNAVRRYWNTKHYGNVLEYWLGNRGLRFDLDGNFIGFLEP